MVALLAQRPSVLNVLDCSLSPAWQCCGRISTNVGSHTSAAQGEVRMLATHTRYDPRQQKHLCRLGTEKVKRFETIVSGLWQRLATAGREMARRAPKVSRRGAMCGMRGGSEHENVGQGNSWVPGVQALGPTSPWSMARSWAEE